MFLPLPMHGVAQKAKSQHHMVSSEEARPTTEHLFAPHSPDPALPAPSVGRRVFQGRKGVSFDQKLIIR